nr:MAG TPA: hypothetical protein [Caudoviricetes sp.]
MYTILYTLFVPYKAPRSTKRRNNTLEFSELVLCGIVWYQHKKILQLHFKH